MHVRVRRDADEQMVLAHVYNRLSNVVPVLTVQIFKDDWTRHSAFSIFGDPSLQLNATSPTRYLTTSPLGGIPSVGQTVSPMSSSYSASNSIGNSLPQSSSGGLPRNNSFTNATFYGGGNAFTPIVVPARTDTVNAAPMSPTGSSIPAIRLAANAQNITSARTSGSGAVSASSPGANPHLVSLGSLGGSSLGGGLSLSPQQPPRSYYNSQAVGSVDSRTAYNSPVASSNQQAATLTPSSSFTSTATNFSSVTFQSETTDVAGKLE